MPFDEIDAEAEFFSVPEIYPTLPKCYHKNAYIVKNSPRDWTVSYDGKIKVHFKSEYPCLDYLRTQAEGLGARVENIVFVKGDHLELRLRHKPGEHARIVKFGFEDFKKVQSKLWRYHSQGYCYSTDNVAMHNFLMNHTANKTTQVDHINHDRLDNRRENLRIVTVSENLKNRRPPHRVSTMRGVSRMSKAWVAKCPDRSERGFYYRSFQVSKYGEDTARQYAELAREEALEAAYDARLAECKTLH